jgi:hypothetical protein
VRRQEVAQYRADGIVFPPERLHRLFHVGGGPVMDSDLDAIIMTPS